MGKFDAVEPVAADQVGNSRHIDILKNRDFAAAVQFQLFLVAGTHAGDFARYAAEIYLRAETPFRIAQGAAAVKVIRPNPSKTPQHIELASPLLTPCCFFTLLRI